MRDGEQKSSGTSFSLSFEDETATFLFPRIAYKGKFNFNPRWKQWWEGF
jgi:hypothetical protein